jgi:CBS domain containing-hemolysin-like protein
MTVGELFDRLDYEDPEDDEDLLYKLLSEWTYEQFSDIPKERESFTYHDLTVRIQNMRQQRIVTLVVQLQLPEGGAEA